MNSDLKNILSGSNKDIDNQELLNYLANQLSKSESHEVEKLMAEDEFTNDAMEGLQEISNQNNIPRHLDQLHENLQKQIGKKSFRKNRRWKNNPQTYLVIIIILLLMLLGFVVIKKYSNQNKSQSNTSKTTAANGAGRARH